MDSLQKQHLFLPQLEILHINNSGRKQQTGSGERAVYQK